MIYTDKIHMVADSLKELHEFSHSIGLKRMYFEGVRKKHPHYDVVNKNGNLIKDENGVIILDKAISNGAKIINKKELLLKSKKLHEQQTLSFHSGTN